MRLKTVWILLCLTLVFFFSNLSAKQNTGEPRKFNPGLISESIPNTQLRVHKIGKVQMSITNYGYFGSKLENSFIDPETGQIAPSCQYPFRSDKEHLFQGALWVGAIVSGDTLVSVGTDGWQHIQEMYPDSGLSGAIIKRSATPNHPDYDPEAVSEIDYVATFYDTLTDQQYVAHDPMDGRPHLPLGLKIRQESYSWSDPDFDDFIIFRYVLTNIGDNHLEDAYIGLYYDCDVLYRSYLSNETGFGDDVSGHIVTQDSCTGDNIEIGWSADNDGEPSGGFWNAQSIQSVYGVSFLDFPDAAQFSFNWWVSEQYQPELYDWGPIKQENYRDFGTGGMGTPEGDKNKYYIMSNGEFDYDQMFCGIDNTDDGWLPPPADNVIDRIADGFDTRFLFSFGSFDLMPADSIEFSFVVALGNDLHQYPDAFSNLYDSDNPQLFYESLYFYNLVNSVMAAREKFTMLGLYTCGDFNRDGSISITDIVHIINYVFVSSTPCYGQENDDYNCDDTLNMVDIIYLINYLFRGGDSPCDPDGDGEPEC